MSSMSIHPFNPAMLDDEHFVRNILIAGSVGTGKTNLAKLVLQRAVELGDVVVFDVKGEYRDLVGWLRERGYDAMVLTVGRDPLLKLNPLEPPLGVRPSMWTSCVADIITRVYGLGEPSRRILQDSIKAVYEEHDLFSEVNEVVTWPTLRELEQYVAEFVAQGARERSSQRALESRLHLVTAGIGGKSLNTMVGFDPSFFIGRIVSVELDWTTNMRDQRVIVELLLNALWEYRKINSVARERLQVIVFEEAHRFLPERRPKWELGTRTQLERCYAEGRAYNFGLIAVDQQPSLLSRYVLANSGTRFTGRLASHVDIQLMVDALLMQEVVGVEHLIRKLVPGQVYGQLLYTSNTEAEWGSGYRSYSVPQFQGKQNFQLDHLAIRIKEVHKSKLRSAIINAFKLRCHQQGKQVSSFLLRELEAFVNAKIG